VSVRSCSARRERSLPMLRIYPFILETLERLYPVLTVIERRDRDLGRQLRRASESIALNVHEGMYSRGRNRAARYHTALGSAGEVLACIQVAQCFRAAPNIDAALIDALQRIVATLVKLVERSH
jgi:four helix bundle protein